MKLALSSPKDLTNLASGLVEKNTQRMAEKTVSKRSVARNVTLMKKNTAPDTPVASGFESN
jgi:hypothetical protein